MSPCVSLRVIDDEEDRTDHSERHDSDPRIEVVQEGLRLVVLTDRYRDPADYTVDECNRDFWEVIQREHGLFVAGLLRPLMASVVDGDATIERFKVLHGRRTVLGDRDSTRAREEAFQNRPMPSSYEFRISFTTKPAALPSSGTNVGLRALKWDHLYDCVALPASVDIVGLYATHTPSPGADFGERYSLVVKMPLV